MKKLFLAVAWVVAFAAAPTMAEQFANPFSQHFERRASVI